MYWFNTGGGNFPDSSPNQVWINKSFGVILRNDNGFADMKVQQARDTLSYGIVQSSLFYQGTWFVVFKGSVGCHLRKTDNSGATWETVDYPGYTPGGTMQIHYFDYNETSQQFILQVNSTLYTSPDCYTFSSLAMPGSSKIIAMDHNTLVALNAQLSTPVNYSVTKFGDAYYSTNAGASWVSTLLPGFYKDVSEPNPPPTTFLTNNLGTWMANYAKPYVLTSTTPVWDPDLMVYRNVNYYDGINNHRWFRLDKATNVTTFAKVMDSQDTAGRPDYTAPVGSQRRDRINPQDLFALGVKPNSTSWVRSRILLDGENYTQINVLEKSTDNGANWPSVLTVRYKWINRIKWMYGDIWFAISSGLVTDQWGCTYMDYHVYRTTDFFATITSRQISADDYVLNAAPVTKVIL